MSDMADKDYLAKTLANHSNLVSILPIENRHKNHNIFKLTIVTSNNVHKIISTPNGNKATCFDNVPPKVVKMCADELSVTVTELIDSTYANNLFPNDMRKSELCPLFKKKIDMIKNNYRSVSIFKRFWDYHSRTVNGFFFWQIFNDMLCAYHKKYGCEHVLLKVIDLWKNALDSNNFAGSGHFILIDLSKAFDCVPHGLLITKLKAYGLTDDACRFMSSYLSGWFQRVHLSNEKKSYWSHY